VEPSAHSCGTAQKAEAVSSKKSVLSTIDADGENASIAIRPIMRRRSSVAVRKWY
jgi:hypothetical protein